MWIIHTAVTRRRGLEGEEDSWGVEGWGANDSRMSQCITAPHSPMPLSCDFTHKSVQPLVATPVADQNAVGLSKG